MLRKKINCQNCFWLQQSYWCSDGLKPFFADSKEDLVILSGEKIFAKGQKPEGLHIIKSGLVKLKMISEKGHPYTIRIAGPGDILGFRYFFAEEPYQTDAVAIEDVTVCHFSTEVVQKNMAENPEFAKKIQQLLAKELIQADLRWVNQIDQDVSHRVAEAVLCIQEKFGPKRLTRKEIGQWVGTATETVIRTLSQFEKMGYLNLKGREIQIKDKTGLQKHMQNQMQKDVKKNITTQLEIQ